MKLPILASTFAFALSSPIISYAATYDEAVNGNLSNDHTAPTLFAPTSPSSNTIKGQVSSNQDYVTFTVPQGAVLSSLTLDSYSTTGNANNVSFFAIAPGASSPIVPPGNTATGLLGWILWNASNIGTDLLPTIGTAANGATGFSGSLSAGTYTFWIQDTGQTVDYQLSFVLTALPITVPPVTIPSVTVAGQKKLTVSKAKIKLKGTTTGTVTSVAYRVGSKGAFKPASGTSSWTINAKLKPGKNIIYIQATNAAGTSAPVKIVVVKK